MAPVIDHDYRFALARDTEVLLLIHETTGALHPGARSYLSRLARAHALRQTGDAEDETAGASFRRFWLGRISAGLAAALGAQLLAGAALQSAPFRRPGG